MITRRRLLAASGSLPAALLVGGNTAGAGVSAKDLAALRRKLRGSAVVAGDPAYEQARVGKGMLPVARRFPSVIVLPKNADDVARTLDFVRRTKQPLSIRSGGHDVLGASTGASGVMIDLAAINHIRIDPATGIARVGAGARAGEMVAAGGALGWVPVVGQNPNVGIGGLTLGGGMGWFAGTHGAVVDNLLAATVVTADGRILRASKDANADLFWALRGGGGNFGVVTEFTFQMQPIRSVLAGTLSYDAAPKAFMKFFADYLANSPDALELTLAFTTGSTPVPIVQACWLGKPEEGEALLRPLRRFAKTRVDTIKQQDFAVFAREGQPDASVRMFHRGTEFDALSDEVGERLDSVLRSGGADRYVGMGHYVHGALARAASGSTPFVRRAGHLSCAMFATWSGAADQSETDGKVAWVRAAAEALKPVSAEAIYINYLSSDSPDQIRTSYGENYRRLLDMKRKYDPENLFRSNRNVTRAA